MVQLSKTERELAANALESVTPIGLGLRPLLDGPRGWTQAMAPDRADEIADALTQAWRTGIPVFELANRFRDEQHPARRTKRGNWAAGVRPGDQTS